ncbi:hypothetical protein [Spiroplasma endosymbiont of Asaphidion curtum]|uniref:hypothetical protein n=1 Tax=Spiroplasma endosymbiont of Asaphidion curtum TaxID=3066281 RepID=UPI00313EEBC8
MVNVAGGLQATTIVACMQNKIAEPQLILFNYRKKIVKKIKIKFTKRYFFHKTHLMVCFCLPLILIIGGFN